MVMDVVVVRVRFDTEITPEQNDKLAHELQRGNTYIDLHDRIHELVERLGIENWDGVAEVTVV